MPGQKLARYGRQPLRFLSVGVLNTLLGLSVIYAAMALLKLSAEVANMIGYSVALIFSFFLNRAWTFEHQGYAPTAFIRFGLVTAVAYSANLATVIGLMALDLNPYMAQIGGILPFTLLGYLGNKFYSFR